MVIMKQNKIDKLNWNMVVNVKQKRNCYYKIEIKLHVQKGMRMKFLNKKLLLGFRV